MKDASIVLLGLARTLLCAAVSLLWSTAREYRDALKSCESLLIRIDRTRETLPAESTEGTA